MTFFNMVSEKMCLFVICVNPPSQKRAHTLGAGAVDPQHSIVLTKMILLHKKYQNLEVCV